jgi:dipeptidyl aminopeptidase/acylaminoacyl peptidase
MANINLRLVVIVFSFFLIVLLAGWLPHEKQASKYDFPILKGPYLGQKSPKETPIQFAPEIFFNRVCTQTYIELHSSVQFSPDGKELYFELQSRSNDLGKYKKTIMFMKMENGKWTKPMAVFASAESNDSSPILSPDGKRLYFASDRYFPGKEEPKDKDIWFVEKSEKGWSEPQNLDPPINTSMIESCPSFTKDGTLYFYRNLNKEDGWGEIFRSRFINGKYTKPKRLGNSINTQGYEASPLIAPDESYLIFYSLNRSEGKGQYISFRRKDGSWTKAKNMGDSINAGGLAFCSSFSPDRKYFFFLLRKINQIKEPEREPGIYWVDAKIIDELKPEELK